MIMHAIAAGRQICVMPVRRHRLVPLHDERRETQPPTPTERSAGGRRLEFSCGWRSRFIMARGVEEGRESRKRLLGATNLSQSSLKTST
jgi:hypothetical protein